MEKIEKVNEEQLKDVSGGSTLQPTQKPQEVELENTPDGLGTPLPTYPKP